MKFRTTIEQSSKTTTGIRVPKEVVESLGSSKRPAVRVTINGFTYRSTVTVMGGVYMVSLSAENRAGAGVAGGDEVDIAYTPTINAWNGRTSVELSLHDIRVAR